MNLEYSIALYVLYRSGYRTLYQNLDGDDDGPEIISAPPQIRLSTFI